MSSKMECDHCGDQVRIQNWSDYNGSGWRKVNIDLVSGNMTPECSFDICPACQEWLKGLFSIKIPG